MRTVFTAIAVLLLAVSALADDWASPTPRIFASPGGSLALRVISPERWYEQHATSTAVLFRPGRTAADDKVVWERNLVNVPMDVVIDEVGRVATLDTYAQTGYKHAVVIYNRDGNVIADYALEDLLTAEQIGRVPRSTSSRWWRKRGQCAQAHERELRVPAVMGLFRFAMEDGKVIERPRDP